MAVALIINSTLLACASPFFWITLLSLCLHLILRAPLRCLFSYFNPNNKINEYIPVLKKGNNGKTFIPVILAEGNCSIDTGWKSCKHFKYYHINFKYLSRRSCSHNFISILCSLNNSCEAAWHYSLERELIFHDRSLLCMLTVPHGQWSLMQGSWPTESLVIRGAPTALQNNISLQI